MQQVINAKAELNRNLSLLQDARNLTIQNSTDRTIIEDAETRFHDSREAVYETYFNTMNVINNELIEIASREEVTIERCDKLKIKNKETIKALHIANANVLDSLKHQFVDEIKSQQAVPTIIKFTKDRLHSIFADLLLMKIASENPF